MIHKYEPLRLTPSTIHESPNFDVKSSSFFSKWSQLSSPEDVRRKAEARHLTGVDPDDRKVYSATASIVRPPPIISEELKLFVK